MCGKQTRKGGLGNKSGRRGTGEKPGRGQASDDGDLNLAVTTAMGKSTPMSDQDGKWDKQGGPKTRLCSLSPRCLDSEPPHPKSPPPPPLPSAFLQGLGEGMGADSSHPDSSFSVVVSLSSPGRCPKVELRSPPPLAAKLRASFLPASRTWAHAPAEIYRYVTEARCVRKGRLAGSGSLQGEGGGLEMFFSTSTCPHVTTVPSVWSESSGFAPGQTWV